MGRRSFIHHFLAHATSAVLVLRRAPRACEVRIRGSAHLCSGDNVFWSRSWAWAKREPRLLVVAGLIKLRKPSRSQGQRPQRNGTPEIREAQTHRKGNFPQSVQHKWSEELASRGHCRIRVKCTRAIAAGRMPSAIRSVSPHRRPMLESSACVVVGPAASPTLHRAAGRSADRTAAAHRPPR